MRTSTDRAGGVYHGWIMVAVCMFTLMLTVGATTNAFGLYVLPVSQAFGLSRASTNTGMILLNAGAAVAALVIGRLLDRYPARIIMGVSGFVLGASLIALGLSSSLALDAAIIAFPLGFAMSGVGTLTAPTLVARWFVAHRARALGLTMMGMSGGTILVVPQIAWLIEATGWRNSLIALGAIVGVLIVGLALLVRDAPGENDVETTAIDTRARAERPRPDEARPPLTTRELLAMPAFWMIALSTAFVIAVFQGIIVSLVPMGRGLGFSTTAAAGLISGLGVAALISKLLVAWAGDRVERPLALALLFGLMAIASVTLLVADSYAMMLAGCLMVGVSAGATMPLELALLADRFGARSFGTANGTITFAIAVLAAGAVRLSGEAYDRTGGYAAMFYADVVLSLVAAALMLRLRGDVRPAARAAGEAVG